MNSTALILGKTPAMRPNASSTATSEQPDLPNADVTSAPRDPHPSPTDSVTLGAMVGVKPLNKREMAARYTNNLALHLLFSDTPAVMSMAANVTPLPPGLTGFLDTFNAVNTLTGVVAIAADLREIRGTYRNPHATQTDKLVDVSHLIAGDILSTAASLTPLVTPLSHPLALAFFMGGQAVGIGMDVMKTAYDFKRKGQQSACGD